MDARRLILPPGASPALACVLLAIDMAASTDALGRWWAEHQPALRALAAPERAQAIAAKDARKAALARRPASLPAPRPERAAPGIPPPSVVLPPLRRVPGYDGRRLI